MAVSAPALDALLAKYQVDLTAEEVLDELDSALASVPGPSVLSHSEVDFLSAHGGASTADAIGGWSADAERRDRALAAVAQLASTLANSASIKEAATILGLDRSRVSRRITGKSLWSFDVRGGRRIPRWQFLGKGLLPGLDVIVPEIPQGLSPGVLEAFMHAPQPDFGNRAPIEHLAAGGDPAVVAGFVADLGRW